MYQIHRLFETFPSDLLLIRSKTLDVDKMVFEIIIRYIHQKIIDEMPR